jgi:hypothetical protein
MTTHTQSRNGGKTRDSSRADGITVAVRLLTMILELVWDMLRGPGRPL